jgi:hypothetical protein
MFKELFKQNGFKFDYQYDWVLLEQKREAEEEAEEEKEEN